MDPMEPLREVYHLVALGSPIPVDLPDVAAGALAAGVDSVSLAELALLLRGDVPTARVLLLQAMAELGIPGPSPEPTDPHELAKFIAARILAGAVSPEQGAWQIGLRAWGLDRTTGLGIFLGLASAAEDYPEDRDHYELEIIREARKLVGDDVRGLGG
jgi:hypothetical protein